LQHIDHLSDTQQLLVLDLINRTTNHDGTPPIAEHILLHLRYGGDKADSHLLVEKDNQVIGYAHLDQTDLVAGPSVELVVDPKYRGAGVEKQLLSKAIEICGKELRLWVHGEQPAAIALATSFGFEKIRTVLQMSRPLTEIQQISDRDNEIGKDIAIRNFLTGTDSDAWLSLNNKVFKDHPEQGKWQLSDLNIRLNEEWFDEKGFFIVEKNKRIIGSVWTKIYGQSNSYQKKDFKNHSAQLLGEIYVTCVDSKYQGKKLGKTLTIWALNYLLDQGIKKATLYVDEKNLIAINLYTSLGFQTDKRDFLLKMPKLER
jgi:mycothiol synthase